MTPPPNESPYGQRAAYDQEAMGQSEAFFDFQERLSGVAAVDRPVLIIGERGTGKELAARRIHYLSRRWQEPLVELNCAALSPTLIESELFGHESGAFTGATRLRRGRFELGDGGTLFLDELGNIPVEVQEKILRVVEYGRFERVGGTEPVNVNVRIVGATNADLPALADAGQFMRDLLDRLSFEVLYVPPLRERQEDIMLLANHFALRMAMELGREEAPEFSEEVERALESHVWRGNVRELKNVVERAVYRARSTRIEKVMFDPFQSVFEHQLEGPSRPINAAPAPGAMAASSRAETPAPGNGLDFNAAVEALERRLLREALEATRFNQRRAADRLQLTYHQFRGLYRKYQDFLQE
ncbi:MAG: phage shock protein operon transcriptional activator [Candidatus Hydrogenedentes bacterium]|nr:phage shock protein operon transcriptional activator [Candidatus Hydrogenedentota bacterium]